MEIIKDPDFKTWDLGKLPGTPQTGKAQGILDDQLINKPQERAGETGESFLEFSSRVLTAIKRVIATAPNNTVVLTHNSVFGLIKLWDRKGRPKYLDKPFRTEYTKQDSDTGAHYTIKSEAGTLYICRHGETEDNKKGNFRGDDVELTRKGQGEAKQLGKDLADVKITQLISSPLPRAIETSEAILDGQKKGNEKGSEDTDNDSDTSDGPDKKEGSKKESKGLNKSVFLYMEPTKEDDPKTFASCASCRMFLKKQQLCSLHGPDLKVDEDDSCGLFVRGKAPTDEVNHMVASVTPQESGFTEGPVQCMNCHYFMRDGDHNDCLLFRLMGIEDYHVPEHACCNAFSPRHEPAKEDSKDDKDN